MQVGKSLFVQLLGIDLLESLKSFLVWVLKLAAAHCSPISNSVRGAETPATLMILIFLKKSLANSILAPV